MNVSDYEKWCTVIVSVPYIAMVRWHDGDTPARYYIGEGSYGKAIAIDTEGCDEPYLCVNFEQIVSPHNVDRQYWIPLANLSLMIEVNNYD